MNADDPKFTAYALGEELSPEDKATIEKALAASPELRAELEQIRSLSGVLGDAFRGELTEDQISSASSEEVVLEKSFARMLEEEKNRKRPSLWPSIMAIAASFSLIAVVLVYNQMGEDIQTVEVNPLTQIDLLKDTPPPPPVMRFSAPSEDVPLLAMEKPAPEPVEVYSQVTVVELRSHAAPLVPAPEVNMAETMVDSFAAMPEAVTREEPPARQAVARSVEATAVAEPPPVVPPSATEANEEAKSIRTMIIRARSLFAAGELGQAKALFEQVLQLSPQNSEALYFIRRIEERLDPNAPRRSREDMLASTTRNWQLPSQYAPEAGLSAQPASPHARAGEADALAATGYVSYERVHGVGAVSSSRYNPRPAPGDTYENDPDLPFRYVEDAPLSTFSVDVDTASYSNARRFLQQKQPVPSGAVRVEEFVNYFDYDYAPPTSPDEPFNILTEVTTAPWNEKHQIVRVALKGYELGWDDRPPSNLVFLIDVSGSMARPDRLPLVKRGLQLLIEQLDERDSLAIVTYASGSQVALPPTPMNEKEKALRAIEALQARGATHASEGISTAYRIAREQFVAGGNNRVILCTDGDFNVGETDGKTLAEYIREKSREGIFLSVFGFGRGNLRDARLEQLSNEGNGSYGYIDSPTEARRVFVQRVSSNFITIAKDVKLQVEFNPANVSAYRLIGYNNRRLADEDFNDDRKDAGDVGSGHEITAFYEIVPAGIALEGVPSVDPLRYGQQKEATRPKPSVEPNDALANELMTVKIRYKDPEGERSQLLTHVVEKGVTPLVETGSDFRFGLAVAAFGEKLRRSTLIRDYSYDDIRNLAEGALGENKDGLRTEFISLIDAAEQLELR